MGTNVFVNLTVFYFSVKEMLRVYVQACLLLPMYVPLSITGSS